MDIKGIELELYKENYPDSNIINLQQTINYNKTIKFLINKIAELKVENIEINKRIKALEKKFDKNIITDLDNNNFS